MSRIVILFLILAGTSQRIIAADLIELLPAVPIDNGSMTAMRKAGDIPDTVLVHFHGAASTLKKAFTRSNHHVVLVVVNFPGLSSAYSGPFRRDGELFDRILEESRTAATGKKDGQWKRVYVSSFSAGYGAVREILSRPSIYQNIEGIVAADSIYAGRSEKNSKRDVSEDDMRHFHRFAVEATKGRKTFVLSHSAQATPYASTTETADYLLNALDLSRMPDATMRIDQLQQTSIAKRGKFLVLGFEGTSGEDHMRHLHYIDRFWNHLLPAPEARGKRITE